MADDATYYGVNACLALAEARPDAVHRALISERTMSRFGPLLSHLAERRRPYRVLDDEELTKVAGSRHHEGICLVADELESPRAADFLASLGDGPAQIAFLDGVDNPHNVGAILRTCAHFGALGLAGLDDQLPAAAGATARVAQGAAEVVPMLRWKQPRKALDMLADRGFVRIATVVEGGEDLYSSDLPERCIFMLGAEADGLSASAFEAADMHLRIPGTGAVESLNVASAAAVLLAEHARRFRR